MNKNEALISLGYSQEFINALNDYEVKISQYDPVVNVVRFPVDSIELGFQSNDIDITFNDSSNRLITL